MSRPLRASVLLLVVFLLVVTVVLAGCDSGGVEPPPEDRSVGDVTVPPSTKVLETTSLSEITSVSDDLSSFTFAGASSTVDEIETNDVIVGGVSDQTPQGFLRKVTRVERSGEATTLTTTQATLDEAIKEGTIELTRNLDPEDLEQSKMLAPGVKVMQGPHKSAKLGEFFVELRDVVVYDADDDTTTTNDQVTVSGGIAFDPTIRFSLEIRRFSVERLRFAPEVTTTTNLNVSASVNLAELEAEQTVVQHYFAPIAAAGFPIVYVPRLDINVGVAGAVSVGVSTGVNYQMTTTAGLQYADDRWSPVSEFDHEAGFAPVEASAGASAELYGSAPMSLLLYGITGPYVETKGYLAAEIDVLANPWWALYFGIDVGVGMRLDLIWRDEIEKAYPGVIGFRTELASADGAFTDDDDGDDGGDGDGGSDDGGGSDGGGDDGGGDGLPANGLIASYSFSGDASDDTGNGFDGTVYGAELTTDRFGSANSAYEFKETDDYIDLGKASSILTGDAFSISTWVLISTQREGNRQVQVLSNEDYYEDYGDFTLNNVEYRFYRGNNQDSRLPFDDPLSAGEWHHIVVTHDRQSATLYLNGSEVSSSDGFPSFSASGRNLHVGPSIPDRYSPVDGKVDDVRLYDRALSRDEVQQLLEADSGLP
jgi:uncharacterized membrane protein YgcG